MTKFLFATVFSMFLFFVPCFAQESDEINKNKNFFYVGPADLFFNTLEIGYEKEFKNTNSIAIFGGFKLSEKAGYINKIGGNGELQYRINLLYKKQGLSKLAKNFSTFAYFAPYLQYRYEEITDKVYINEVSSVNQISTIDSYFGGLGFGCRLTGIENRFCLNVFAGGGLKYSDLYGDKKYSDFFQVGYTGIAPKFGFQMGIAF